MAEHPLAGEVTRPESFDPDKDYGVVLARGDQWIGDFDLNDMQRILRQDLAVMARLLFREGAVVFEAGGTLADPVVGTVLGDDELGVTGTYRGLETQLYTVRVAAGGIAGTATFTWESTGADGPSYPGQEFPITAIAPTVADGLADLATYGHALGIMGAVVVFANPNGFVTAPNSWVVQATYGARPPVVSGTTLIVSDCIVPVQGRLHRVPGQTLTYPVMGSGISTVYGEWTRTIVKHGEDPLLRDPLSDTPMAWRERWRVVLRIADTSSEALPQDTLERRVFALYRWDRATDEVTRVVPNPYAIDIGKTEGALDAERLLNIDQNETFRGTLATRTNDAHGSFVVAPLAPIPRARVSSNAPTPGKIRLSIPPITASVEGVRVDLALPTEIEVDQATDVLAVADEPHTYTASANPFALNKALGSNPLPVKQVTQLTAQVRVGNPGVGGYEAVTRSAAGLFDNLAKTPCIAIVRISNTQGGASNYTVNVDYRLTGNQVEWIAGGSRPSNGATYYVVYDYQKTMVSGADFLLTAAGAIDFAAVGGDDPVEGTVFQVDYDYYLHRHDVLTLRPTGEIAVLRGQPAEVPADPIVPQLTLPYVKVVIPPNSTAITLQRFGNDRVTMERLNLALDALYELTVNQALADLETQARARTSASLLDILTDAFATTDLADLTYNVGAIVFDATIDMERRELTLPFTQAAFALTRQAAPGGQTDVRVGRNFWTLPYAHELAIDSPRWSTQYPVNPYADFRPEPPLMVTEPSQDRWVDTTTLTSTATRIVQNGAHVDMTIVGGFTTVQEQVALIPAVYARQITLSFVAHHLVPGEKVRLYIDGKAVQITATPPATQGGDAFTVVATAAGFAAGTYTIPALVPVGTVLVQLYGDSGVGGSTWPGSYTVRATSTFTSFGVTRQVSTEIILTLVQNDPIAQSFAFPAARMLSRVDVPMAAKPAGTTPLVFEVRATDRAGRASTPTDVVLARFARLPSAVNVGPASSNLYDLDDPVIVPPGEFRAIVLRSASNAYQAYVAQLGQADRSAGGFIQANQIESGIFMDSSNNTDWTLHQGWDLRCKAYVAAMSALTAYLYLNRVTSSNMTAFFLAADQVVPDQTSIEWQYSVDGKAISDGTKIWTTFPIATLVELAAIAGTLDVRAIFRTNSAYVTPAIALRSLALQVQSNKLATQYVSKLKTLTASATRVLGGLWIADAAGGTTTVYVSLDDGTTWASVTLAADGTGAVPDGFTAYKFDKSSLTAGTRLRLRVDQTTPNRANRPRVRNAYVYAQPA